MRYDAVFFDSGGTLFGFGAEEPGADPSPDPTHAEVTAGEAARATQALRWLGHDVDPEPVAALVAELRTAARSAGPAWTEEDLVEGLMRRLDLPTTREQVVWATGVVSGPRYASWLFPGVAENLQRLADAGLGMGLIANTGVPGWVMDRNFRGVDLLRFFPVRVYSGDEGVEKPDPEIFHLAAARAGVEGQRLAYMGDLVDKDVAGANAAGWASILFRSRSRTSDGRADHEIDAWAELPELLL